MQLFCHFSLFGRSFPFLLSYLWNELFVIPSWKMTSLLVPFLQISASFPFRSFWETNGVSFVLFFLSKKRNDVQACGSVFYLSPSLVKNLRPSPPSYNCTITVARQPKFEGRYPQLLNYSDEIFVECKWKRLIRLSRYFVLGTSMYSNWVINECSFSSRTYCHWLRNEQVNLLS